MEGIQSLPTQPSSAPSGRSLSPPLPLVPCPWSSSPSPLVPSDRMHSRFPREVGRARRARDEPDTQCRRARDESHPTSAVPNCAAIHCHPPPGQIDSSAVLGRALSPTLTPPPPPPSFKPKILFIHPINYSSTTTTCIGALRIVRRLRRASRSAAKRDSCPNHPQPHHTAYPLVRLFWAVVSLYLIRLPAPPTLRATEPPLPTSFGISATQAAPTHCPIPSNHLYPEYHCSPYLHCNATSCPSLVASNTAPISLS
jgi:hypothetical protein